MSQTYIKIATLHPDKIARYEQLHAEIPAQNLRHMREGGYHSLRIVRRETTLVMIIVFDETLVVPDRVVDEAAEADWQRQTGECFATPWADAPEIFVFVNESVETNDTN